MIPINKSNTWYKTVILFSVFLFSCSYLNTISKSKNGAVRLKIVDTVTIDDSEIIHNPFYAFYFYEDKIYAVNHSSLKISVFDEFSKRKFHIGGYGKSPSQFISINDIIHLSNQHFIVIDAVTQKITEFDSKGVFQKTLIDFSYKIKDTIGPPPLKIDDFVIAPNPDAHIMGDSIIYIRGSEQSLYNHNFRTKKSLYRKFSFPDFIEISKGGHYTKIYNNNGFEILENNSSIITNNAFYFIEEATPYITRLTLDLKYNGYVGEIGNSFSKIDKELDQSIFHTKNLQPVIEWLYGKSSMERIFSHGNFIISTYRNNYNFKHYFDNLYRNKFNYFQSFTDSVEYHIGNEKESEYWCQVYSNDFGKYFGEFRLPTRILGYDPNHIYLAEFRNNKINNSIIKCKIEVY